MNAFLSLLVLLIMWISPMPIAGQSEKERHPSLFACSDNWLIYFHSHQVSLKELDAAFAINPIFEIDLAWAHSSFHDSIIEGTPYIGHPEEFYTKLGQEFPINNVSLAEFQLFLKNNPSIKVLIDLKDEAALSYLEEFVHTVGTERCLVHAFIKNWTFLPEDVLAEPHWYREEIDLFKLDKTLNRLRVPLIANCHGFNDEHVERHGLIKRMIEDSRQCQSVVSLGLYFPGATLPNVEFLKSINQGGYYAWVNGNLNGLIEKVGSLKCIMMSDDITRCTRF